MASSAHDIQRQLAALKATIRDEVVAALTRSAPELLRSNDLSKLLGIPAESTDYTIVREVLEELEEQKVIYKGPRRRYGRVVPDTDVQGKIRMVESGRWILIPDGGTQPALRFDRDGIGIAFHGDTVRARPLSAALAEEIPWGEVTRVVERATDRIVGTLREGRDIFLQPDGRKIHRTITISRKHLNGAKIGEKVVVELMEWEDPEADPCGKVVRRVGKAGEMGAELASLLEEFDVRIDFPADVDAEAESFPSKLRPSDLKDRRDLRGDLIMTIDPEDARDFDDAISIKQLDDGDVLLGIHIADVSHYVAEGSELDREAYLRGTSIYLVNGVVPMLPERLSNDLCSLRPNEDRLAYSVEVQLSPNGAIRGYEIFKSVIRSKRRFSYEEALAVLEEGKGDHAEELLAINKIAHVLRRNRQRKGSVDFSTTELKFKLDEEGKPIAVIPKKANEATKLIEDCMLLANRVVAEHIGTFKHQAKRKRGGDLNPFLYRIHDSPPKDKLIELANFVKGFGYSIPIDNVQPKDYQKLIEQAREGGHEYVISQVALRSMAKAVYSEHNVGHFGLAFPWYSHFTSPIRRYPDLIVHRLLHEYQLGMSGERLREHAEEIGHIADYSSGRERVATDAERRSVKIAEVEFLSNHVGDVYKATIISILPFGMFAELQDLGIQGLIPVRSLGDDYYHFDERRRELAGRSNGKRYRIGAEIFVRVNKVDQLNQQIDLGILQEDEYHGELSGERPLRSPASRAPQGQRGGRGDGGRGRGGRSRSDGGRADAGGSGRSAGRRTESDSGRGGPGRDASAPDKVKEKPAPWDESKPKKKSVKEKGRAEAPGARQGARKSAAAKTTPKATPKKKRRR